MGTSSEAQGWRIAELRKLRGMSQTALSAATGNAVSNNMLHHLEHGTRTTTLNNYRAIAKVLGVTVDWIADGDRSGLTSEAQKIAPTEAERKRANGGKTVR